MYLNLSILSVFCICKIRVFVKISEFSSHYDGGDGGVVKGRPGLRGNKYMLPFMGDGGCGVQTRHGLGTVDTVWARSGGGGCGNIVRKRLLREGCKNVSFGRVSTQKGERGRGGGRHTSKKGLLLRRWLFQPKKFAEKVRKWCKSTKNGENRQEIVLLPSKMVLLRRWLWCSIDFAFSA